MDLIAHFWARLPQTPPLQRDDLHLVVAVDEQAKEELTYVDINKICVLPDRLRGAMLYVPKAHRADVLALDAACAAAFAAYIAAAGTVAKAGAVEVPVEVGIAADAAEADPEVRPMVETAAAGNGNSGRVAIDFLTGSAEGVMAMVPHLLPVVHKKAPARQLVNLVMQLPSAVPAASCEAVRLARETDIPTLQRWRKLYKEERGILFDANLDAGVSSQKIFVLEHEKQVVAAAKFDLELSRLVEIGGVYTFPEYRKKGFGRLLVEDQAVRIRAMGKRPTLQVDRDNRPAAVMYQRLGWVGMGELARVWLTG
jgi:GNAT superfamily N-acetyltransferase